MSVFEKIRAWFRRREEGSDDPSKIDAGRQDAMAATGIAGDEEIDAEAGTFAFVPRGTPHTFRNKSSQPVRFLGVHSPGIEHMLIALAQATTPQEIGEISARFDTELA